MHTPRCLAYLSRPNHEVSSRAFTLIELLVVISIIAMLIAILMPALGKARKAAQATQCLSQIRQSALAITMYANDAKGMMESYYYDGANEYRWSRRVSEMGYLANPQRATVCPTAKQPVTWNQNFTYASLMDIEAKDRIQVTAGTPRYTYLRLLALSSPSEYFFLADSAYTNTASSWYMLPFASIYMNSTNYTLNMLHSDTASLAYADGHAKLGDDQSIVAASKVMYSTDRVIFVSRNETRVQINP